MKFLLPFLFICTAQAKSFRNAYVSFELPDTWDCVLEQTEWVCRSQKDKESKEAIIILTAKEVGPTDSFDAYSNHLNTAQSVTAKSGAKVLSKIIYAPKKVQINDQSWIDGLHLSSEIPNYYTRYLATIKDRIAILVTFSAHKAFYTKYSQEFFRGVMSLRVIASKNLLAHPDKGIVRPGEQIGMNIQNAIPENMYGTEVAPGSDMDENSDGSKTKNLLLGLALIIAAIAGYILIKTKK